MTSASALVVVPPGGSFRVYADGWAGKVLRYMLPPGGNDLVFEGSVPAWATRLFPQTIEVECCGEILGLYRLEPGEFRLRIGVPPRLRGIALRLKIRASRSFLPSRIPGRGDRRRLAYLLKDIRWA